MKGIGHARAGVCTHNRQGASVDACFPCPDAAAMMRMLVDYCPHVNGKVGGKMKVGCGNREAGYLMDFILFRG
jgi:hypothetical protein